ncbi:tellurite resistance protein TehA-like permease [Nonomuraea jabiensis]|uniref:Tellurite resistance protein TehA-like permease n=1 Tax=Nonomuraea jabiensis TaxID=882448 RepID=A0A7W9GG16_9ACTN|nr:tellurite resistance protein TehA-like permease [Nonomuraea jabiensis]
MVAFTGDGSTMQLGDFLTAVQHRLAIKIVVVRNDTLGLIKWEQMVFLVNMAPFDFVKFAEACAARGMRIEDPGTCADRTREALSWDGPVIIECVVDPHEPPQPAKVKKHQLTALMSALRAGTPNRNRIALQMVKDVLDESSFEAAPGPGAGPDRRGGFRRGRQAPQPHEGETPRVTAARGTRRRLPLTRSVIWVSATAGTSAVILLNTCESVYRAICPTSPDRPGSGDRGDTVESATVERRPPGRWAVLGLLVRRFRVEAFAFVMATGIVSKALDMGGTRMVSAALLVVAGAGFVTLALAYGWWLLRRRTWSAEGGFAVLTIAAASNVLASRILAAGHIGVAVVLLMFGAAVWAVLTYSVPLRLIVSGERHQADGSWFVWVVGTQSVAVATATLTRLFPSAALAVPASVCWAIGLVQYLLIAAIVLARLLARPLRAEELRPHYWIFMGAAAISVLAGAQLLNLPPGVGVVPREFIAGVSLMLWAFCSWLIPLLVALGVWRHVRRRVPLRWEWGLWSMVFPIGMYGVATRELGHSTGMSWIAALGDGEVWPAAAVWLIVFSAMIRASFRLLSDNRAPRMP